MNDNKLIDKSGYSTFNIQIANTTTVKITNVHKYPI